MDVQQALNGLLARYNKIMEELGGISRAHGRLSQAVTLSGGKIEDLAKVVKANANTVSGLQADRRTFQGQLASLARKVDEQEREIRALKERLSMPVGERRGGDQHPGLPYAGPLGEVR